MARAGCFEDGGRRDVQALNPYFAHKIFTILGKLVNMISLKLLAYVQL